MTGHSDDMAIRLARALSGGSDAQVTGLQRLTAGASQEIWSFELHTGNTTERLILRREPPDHRLGDFSIPMDLEARIIDLVHAHGIAVPAVRHRLVEADGLGNGYVMSHVEGETLASRIMRRPEFEPARKRFAKDAGRLLARLHAVPIGGAGLPEYDPAAFVEELDAIYRRNAIPNPVFAMALHWLENNLPGASRRCIVHGDFRLGNLMIGPGGIEAILDWELAHVGDPIEDLGWFTINSWRFGNIDRQAGGLGDLEDLLGAYETESGTQVDRSAFRFWQVCGTLRWGILCAAMVRKVEGGEERTPERAVIARRASETEIDLLDLLVPREKTDA